MKDGAEPQSLVSVPDIPGFKKIAPQFICSTYTMYMYSVDMNLSVEWDVKPGGPLGGAFSKE